MNSEALTTARTSSEDNLNLRLLPAWLGLDRHPSTIPAELVLEVGARHAIYCSIQCGVVRARGEERELNAFAHALYDLGSVDGRFSCTAMTRGEREWVWCAT